MAKNFAKCSVLKCGGGGRKEKRKKMRSVLFKGKFLRMVPFQVNFVSDQEIRRVLR